MTVNEAWLSVLCPVSSRSVTKVDCKITHRNNKDSISASAYLSSIVFIVLYLLLLLFKLTVCGSYYNVDIQHHVGMALAIGKPWLLLLEWMHKSLVSKILTCDP